MFYDLSGAYGANLFGYDFYKECMARGAERVRDLGPVLGPYHPVVAYNVKRLREISGLDEVSFHMSGTEAVMQAVRLARYHTRRTHLVRFAGPYQAGGAMCSRASATRCRARDVHLERNVRAHAACAAHAPRHRLRAVNPLQRCIRRRTGSQDLGPGRQWPRLALRPAGLRGLAAAPSPGLQRAWHRPHLRRGVRRLPPGPGGAQEYFGVRADIVAYGKTVGGGRRSASCAGASDLMKRYRDDRPVDSALDAEPSTRPRTSWAPCAQLLERLETPRSARLYANLDTV